MNHQGWQVLPGESPGSSLHIDQFFTKEPNLSTLLNISGYRKEQSDDETVPLIQVFAGLSPTGVMDAETKELMETPRCGVKDIIGHGATQKRRRRRCSLFFKGTVSAQFRLLICCPYSEIWIEVLYVPTSNYL